MGVCGYWSANSVVVQYGYTYHNIFLVPFLEPLAAKDGTKPRSDLKK